MKKDDAVKTKKTAAPKETPDPTDMSSVFFSQYNTTISPLENKKIAGIIENFIILFQRSLSLFLGKKIEFKFDDIKFCEVKDLSLDKNPFVLSSIRFTPQNQSGLIFFDYPFIHNVIDILFGAGIYKNDAVITSLGKSGGVIAKKVTELCVTALEEAISEYEKIQVNLLKTTEQHGLILNQPLSDQFFNLMFHASFNDVICKFHVAVPDAIFEDMAIKDNNLLIENKDKTTVNDTLRKDIIDSTITLIASLQDIKLKITDIMNLKAGDMIPIHDPTTVYIAHNQKKIFKASVGQSNSLRVVKILDHL